MLRTLPEERKKSKTTKKTRVSKNKTKPNKTRIKEKIEDKKCLVEKDTSKNKEPKIAVKSKMPPISDKAKNEVVKYKDGTTSTYGKFLEQFEARVRYIMQLNEIKPETVSKIVYVNSSTAGLTMTDGKNKFLSIGKKSEEVLFDLRKDHREDGDD